MSLCPICCRVYCDHTLEERNQTNAEMMRPLTPEEEEIRRKEPEGSDVLINLARKNAHLPA